jgi:glutaconate CoA-transferase subunit B
VDFITSPGFIDGSDSRTKLGMPGQGPAMVITDIGCYEFQDSEMILTSLHPGATVDQVRERTGWQIRVKAELETTAPPTHEELRLIREELDPDHLYI